MPLTEGQIVDGKYRVVRRVDEGGMGAVFEGVHVRIGRRVAIKVLKPALSADAEIVERFEREARVAALVSSAHVTDVLDLGDLPTGERYMVMEYLDGESLATRLDRIGTLTEKEAVRLSFQLLDGLMHVHAAGVVHRDLKPDNVYLVTRPNGYLVKIIDFGLAKIATDLAKSTALTRPGAVMGTPHFMAPEQARGQSAEVDARTDLYAVGVIFYRAVTGKVPFDSRSYAELVMRIATETPRPPHEVVAGIDRRFSAIVAKAMARDKGDRYQSARELLQALADWAGIPLILDAALDTTAPSMVGIDVSRKV